MARRTSRRRRKERGSHDTPNKVKDWIVKHQIPAEGWYVAHPDLTVAESGRLKRVGKAVEEFLDQVS